MAFIKKPIKNFLFSALNILLALFLLRFFFIAGRNIVQTFSVANATALSYLRPCPIDYLWELNIHQAPLDKNKISCYADYYDHLLQIFPGFRDAYGILGYCYHYLNDDPKAIRYLKMAIRYYPDYFWNYYNLAVIYINESRKTEALGLLKEALNVDPMTSLKRMFTSQMVYLPLLGPVDKKVMGDIQQHFITTYQSCFVLERILNQAATSKEAQEVIRGLHPQLYAF